MNTIKNILQFILCLAVVLSAPLGYAEDIDIYSRPPDTTPNPNLNPNVLIVIDNSANWAAANQHWEGGIKQGESELRALREIIGTLTEKTNVGLMMFTEGTGSNKNGGYVRFHVRPMNDANKLALAELIGNPSGCTDATNSVSGTPNCILKNFNGSEKVASAKTDYSAVMLEVFKYFGGYTWPDHAQDDVAASSVYGSSVENSSQFGTLRYAGDFDADALAKFDSDAYTDTDKTNYNSPLTSANSCAKNYVIFIGNGFPAQDSPSTLLGPSSGLPGYGVGGDVTQLPLANLASSTTTQTFTLATPACGTYPGDSMTESTAACQAKATDLGATGFPALYPGYSSYTCAPATTCIGGSTVTTSEALPAGAASPTVCGVYATAASCQAALPALYPNYTWYSCTAETDCTYTETNSPTFIGSTGCIAASNASSCVVWAQANSAYNTLYSGFSCANSANCSPNVGGSKVWDLSATFKLLPGKSFTMNGITQTQMGSEPAYSQTITGTYTTLAATPNGTFSAPADNKIKYFDEWAGFLHRTDTSSAPGQQNINTFTIDVFKEQQDMDQTSLLISAAQAGGGKYFKASDEASIINALSRIFSEIQSVNSVFASSSLPVSVNTQGTYLNQVFMGMFRPEGAASPRWPGNLKQYKFKLFNGELRLSDKNGDEAISTTTGFVTPCAASFWTTDTGQYWNFSTAQALGDCTAQTSAFPVAGSTSIYSDAPDGEVVEKGGAAQRLRGVYSSGTTPVLVTSSTNYNVCGVGQTPSNAQCRKLLTCDGSTATSCASLANFDTDNASVAAALSTDLIWWTRGKDVDNENVNLTSATATPANSPITEEMRPSVHGGVVHSQPAVVDYGGTTGTIAFYGADDGVYHAVDGGQGDSEGHELWGFIAPEGYSKLYRLRDNGNDSDKDGITSSLINFPNVAEEITPAPLPKDYFFDGSTGVYQRSGTVWIYPSMRRGGRAIYAFDVSDPTSPDMKWRKGCFTSNTTDDAMCSTGWDNIGQTWSSPTIAYLDGYVDESSNPKPVLIFGGGYDQCEDTDSQTRCAVVSPASRKGANIWFVDAHSGNIIRTYPTHYSVPGDVALLKNTSGYVTYVYASDTGGNVYRINVSSTDGTSFPSWSANGSASDIIIASLSEEYHARKFLNGPSVVPSSGFNAVLLGSGDREHPLAKNYGCGNYSAIQGNYVTNQFYMLMDKPTGYPIPTLTPSSLVDVTSGTTTIATVSGETTIYNTLSVLPSSTKGWRFNFGKCEQTVNEALTIAGVTYFGTNAPTASSGTSCTANLGLAYGYAVDYLTANPIPSSTTLAEALAAATTNGSGEGPGPGVGLVGNIVNGVIAGAEGGSRNSVYIGGGMPPSPVGGVVDVEGTKYPFCIGCIDTSAANSSALQGSKITINPTGRRFRSFWYIEND